MGLTKDLTWWDSGFGFTCLHGPCFNFEGFLQFQPIGVLCFFGPLVSQVDSALPDRLGKDYSSMTVFYVKKCLERLKTRNQSSHFLLV